MAPIVPDADAVAGPSARRLLELIQKPFNLRCGILDVGVAERS